jgi:uncharacterized protein YkwD
MLLPLAVLAAALATLVLAPAASARAPQLAPEGACPNQSDAAAPAAAQLAAMECLTNFARTTAGLPALKGSKPLGKAALAKSDDILTCDEFSHEACGREFTYWMGKGGYLKGCWKAGENIAWGTGEYSTVRSIFESWMESPEHRANILGNFREIGIGLRAGTLEGNAGAAVWTQDFGSHGC